VGRVTRLLNFGAFVELFPGKEGLVHISQLAYARIPKVEDMVKVGDVIAVRVIEIDDMGRVNLSRTAALREQADLRGQESLSGDRHEEFDALEAPAPVGGFRGPGDDGREGRRGDDRRGGGPRRGRGGRRGGRGASE